MFDLPFPLEQHERVSHLTRCTECKTVTAQIYTVIEPFSMDGPLNPKDANKLVKRLRLCSECGTLKLTN